MLFLSFLLRFHARLFVDALRSPAGKGLTSWLSFVMSNCDVVTFPLVSWVGEVLDCIDYNQQKSLPSFLLCGLEHIYTSQHPVLGHTSFYISVIIADTILDYVRSSNGHLCRVAIDQGCLSAASSLSFSVQYCDTARRLMFFL